MTGVPIAPLEITLTICLKKGRKRICIASTTSTSREEANENKLSASACVSAIGVSHSTGLPASMHCLTCAACSEAGVAIYTKSTFLSESILAIESYAFLKPLALPNCSALSRSLETTAYGLAVEEEFNTPVILAAIYPVPTTAALSLLKPNIEISFPCSFASFISDFSSGVKDSEHKKMHPTGIEPALKASEAFVLSVRLRVHVS